MAKLTGEAGTVTEMSARWAKPLEIGCWVLVATGVVLGGYSQSLGLLSMGMGFLLTGTTILLYPEIERAETRRSFERWGLGAMLSGAGDPTSTFWQRWMASIAMLLGCACVAAGLASL
jgi:hypothetical protein